MKQLRITMAVLMAILLLAGTPVSAIAAEWNPKNSDDIEKAFAEDTDAEVIINMENDITMDSDAVLDAKENQKYTINGNGNKISDVSVKGSGDVEINADVGGSESSTAAVTAKENVSVTVNGNVTSESSGVQAEGNANVKVDGNVSADNNGVDSRAGASVTVTGDVEGYNGVYTMGGDVSVEGNVDAERNGVYAEGSIVVEEGIDDAGSNVTVGGNVTSDRTGIVANNATVTVGGDVSGEREDGIWATDNSVVTVDGNVSSEKADGIVIFENSDVTVDGTVTSENGNGITDYGGNATVTGDVTGHNDGIYIESGEINVTGNVTGETGHGIEAIGGTTTVVGDVTGGSYSEGELTEEELLDPDAASNGGDGIHADAGDSDVLTINVTGNVTGGNSMGSAGEAGDGIEANGKSTITVEGTVTGGSNTANPDVETTKESRGGNGISATNTTSVASRNPMVEVTGDVNGGDNNAQNGKGGHGIYATSGSTVIVGGITAGDVTNVTDFGSNVTAGDATSKNGVGGNGIHLVAATIPVKASGSITVENIVTSGKSGEGNTSSALYIESAKTSRNPYCAKVYVWELSDENGNIVGTDNERKTAEDIAKEITNYFVRYIQPSEGTISADKVVGKQDEIITVTGDRAFDITYSRYAVDDPIELEVGTYTVAAPLGGSVLIRATPLGSTDEDPEEPEDPEDPEVPEDPEEPEEPKEPEFAPPANAVTPQTGDMSNIAMCMAFFVLSLTGIVTLAFRKRTVI